MTSKFLSSFIILAIGAALPACSSVTDGLPVVKIERKTPKSVVTQNASFTSPSPIGSGAKVQQAEAALVCENDNMRARAADRNNKNDSARVLILEDNDNSSSQVIGEVVVNCRDYFTDKSAGLIAPNAPLQNNIAAARYNAPNQDSYQGNYQSAPTSAPYVAPKVKPNTQRHFANPAEPSSGLFYSVRTGDTLYRIARNNCTSVNAIAQLNGISDPTQIDVNDILRIPARNCD